MYRFYVEEHQIEGEKIVIVGDDVNHIKNVLRMRIKEELIVCDGQGKDYHCSIEELTPNKVTLLVLKISDTESELKTKLILFQGLPKKDKMELIVQKAVELGAYEIIPVMTKRCIVKLEDKKKELKKIERWQQIAEAAAKQSKRGIIPKVREVMSFEQALTFAESLEYNILPFEHEEGIAHTQEVIHEACEKSSIGIWIGPEGGFEDAEVEAASKRKIEPVTLGKRILRTETAGLTTLSLLMFQLELRQR